MNIFVCSSLVTLSEAALIVGKPGYEVLSIEGARHKFYFLAFDS